MAGNGVDIAKAYVHLIPSMEGAQGTIADAIIPSASKAGDKAGSAAGGKFSGAFKTGIAALGGAAAVTGAFAGLFKVGDTFDKMTDTIRVGSGAAGKDLDGLVEVAKNVGAKVPSSFEDIGTVVADVNTRMGLTGKTMETVASQYLQAGNILGEAVDVGKTSAAFNAFKISGEDVSGSLDHLFQVSQATGIGMNDLAAQVSANAPAVQALGFSFEETAVLVGSLDKAGLNSTAVMASMSKGLVTLAKDGEQPKEAFARVTKELGAFVESGDDAGALDLASKVFGTRGASQFVGALKSGAINMEDLGKAAGQTADTILGTADETASFGEQWAVVKNQALLALEPLATTVFSSISDGLTDVMPYLQQFGTWLAENPALLTGLAIGLAAIAAVLLVAAAAQFVMNSALLMSPITWIVLAIVALVAGIVYLATQTTFFQDVWANVWGFIQATITNVGNFIGTVLNWIGTTWATVWGAVSSFAASVWNGIVGFITGAINNVKTVISVGILAAKIIWATALGLISSTASNIWNGITGFISGAINGVKSTISNVMDTIKSVWSGAWNAVKSTATGAWDGIMGFFRGAIGTVSGIFGSIADAIASPFRNAFNGIAGFWNSTVGQISFKIPDWVPGVGGNGWSVPSIPMLAEGGVITRPTLAVVGEAGPEAVIPLSKLSQHLPKQEEGAAASAGSTSIRDELSGMEFAFQIGTERVMAKMVRKGERGLQRA